MMSSVDLFTVTNPIVKTEYFYPEIRKVAKFIKEYYDSYRSIPNSEQIHAETEIVLNTTEITLDQYAYCVSEVEQFCKRKAMEHAVLESVALIEKEDYGAVEALIREAVTVSITKSLGLEYYVDPLTRLERLRDSAKPLSTGWSDVDKVTGGGFNIGDLVLFSANSGGGKSVTMQNYADNMNSMGHHGIYFSFELNEDLISKRHDSIVTGIHQVEVLPRYKEVAAQVMNAAKTKGTLLIVQMQSPTPNDLRAYLKEYELKYKRKPKFLIVDYIGLMRSNEKIDSSDSYTRDKLVSEELRNIGQEYQAIVCTAAQQNRDAIDKLELNQGNIAGGISKIDTCDVYISIVMTDAMRASGDIMFQFLKTRSSDGVGQNVNLKWCSKTLKISDREGEGSISLKGDASKRGSGVMMDSGMPFKPKKQRDEVPANLVSFITS